MVRQGFSTHTTETGLLDGIILGPALHCRLLNSISGLHRPEASSIPRDRHLQNCPQTSAKPPLGGRVTPPPPWFMTTRERTRKWWRDECSHGARGEARPPHISPPRRPRYQGGNPPLQGLLGHFLPCLKLSHMLLFL